MKDMHVPPYRYIYGHSLIEMNDVHMPPYQSVCIACSSAQPQREKEMNKQCSVVQGKHG